MAAHSQPGTTRRATRIARIRIALGAARATLAADWETGVAQLRDLLRSREVHLALWLCLPALILGVALRAHYCAEAPYGYFLSDSRNFIDSARGFLKSPLAVFADVRRTFLAPVLYSVPVGLGWPLLRVIPWGQHAIGAGMIVLSGLLCAAWFRHWRYWIIPLTMIVAAHPTILWYEHMVLPESMFVVLTLATALAVALYLRMPSPPALLILLLSIFLTAGARQEGFMYSIAAMAACAMALRNDRRRMAWHLGAVCLFVVATMCASGTRQGGQMLLTSVIHHAPDHLWLTPDYSSRARALRDRFAPQWPAYPADHNKAREVIVGDMASFLRERRGLGDAEQRLANNRTCKWVALEIAARRWWVLPGMAYHKWLATHLDPPSPIFGPEWPTNEALRKAFGKEDSKERKYLRGLFGHPYESADAFERDLRTIYYRDEGLGPLRAWQEWFCRWSLWPQDPNAVPEVGPEGARQELPRLPWLYPLGVAGLLAAAATVDARRRTAMLTWLAMLLWMGFVIAIVGSLRSRYRLSFEPYWYFGLVGWLEASWALARARLPFLRRTGGG